MAKPPLSNRSRPSKLQGFLPSLTKEETKDMYHVRTNLVLDKSTKFTHQLDDLQNDIGILAEETKLEIANVHAKSPSKKSSVESRSEGYKTIMGVAKKEEQCAEIAEAKEVIVTEESRRKLHLNALNVTRNIYKKVEVPASDNVKLLAMPKKKFEACTKKTIFRKATQIKKFNLNQPLALGLRLVERQQLTDTGEGKETASTEKFGFERPKYKIDSASVRPGKNFCGKAETPTNSSTDLKTNAVYNKKFEDERRKINVFWPPQEKEYSSLKQKITNYFELKRNVSQSNLERVDYQKLKENYDALEDEYQELSRLNGELSDPDELDNLFSLAIRPTNQVVESLCRQPSDEILKETLDSGNFACEARPSKNIDARENVSFSLRSKINVTSRVGLDTKTAKNEEGKLTKVNSKKKKEGLSQGRVIRKK